MRQAFATAGPQGANDDQPLAHPLELSSNKTSSALRVSAPVFPETIGQIIER